jgi:uncharacterized protein (TIGR02118 family)
MVRISIFYPNVTGSRFDFDYYLQKHMTRSIHLLSSHPGFRNVSVERGLSGAAPGSDPVYSAICHYLFESIDAFMAAFTPHAAELQGDIPNYTNVAPVIQVNDVLILK